jgi:hypothetical protein
MGKGDPRIGLRILSGDGKGFGWVLEWPSYGGLGRE